MVVSGKFIREIEVELSESRSTVGDAKKRKTSGVETRTTHVGCPHKLTERNLRFVKREVESSPNHRQ